MAIDGTYEVELATAVGPQSVTLTLVTVGRVLNGTIDGYFGKQGFSGGRVSGDEISFLVTLQSPVGEMHLEVDATVDEDEISGEVKLGSFRPTAFKGKRV